MKLSVEDGIVVCTYDSRYCLLYHEKEYLRDTAGFWEPICNGKLKLHYTPNTVADELERAKEEYEILCKVKPRYGNLCVYVDDTFQEKLQEVYAMLEPERKRERAEIEAEAKKQYQLWKWEFLCKHGCGDCKYKRIDGDDFCCVASGDLLDDKQVPKVINGIHYLFNYEAFPSDNCPFKVN